MIRTRRNPGAMQQAEEHEFSPRMKMLIFFLYFLVTLVAVRGWMIIIETENIYYETAAAFGTMIVLVLIYYTAVRIAYGRRQHQAAASGGHRPSTPISDAEMLAAHQRLQLRRLYGENIETFLEGNGGLSRQMVDNLLRHFTYEFDRVREIACVKSDVGLDLEAGAEAEAGATGTGCKSDLCVINADECPVCLSDFAEGDALTELPCGHAYHRACITSWLLNRNLCPMCKQVVVQRDDLTIGLPTALADALPPPAPSIAAAAYTALTTAGRSTPTQHHPAGSTGVTPERVIPRRRSHSGPSGSGPMGALFGQPARISTEASSSTPPTHSYAQLLHSRSEEARDTMTMEDLERATGEEVTAESGTSLTQSAATAAGAPPPPAGEVRRGGMAGMRGLSINDISDLQAVHDNDL